MILSSAPVTIINDNACLTAFCARQSTASYITVDTEFMRERTYWPLLCLIQVAGPKEAVVIDALARGLDLTPFFQLLTNASLVKVFHAARQDVEIFWHIANIIPTPLFDTQIAAMACGFGDSISYSNLVDQIVGVKIDKDSRMTDWSRRPLTERQLDYALSDVLYLRNIYQTIMPQLRNENRTDWLTEEMAILENPETYSTDPEIAYKRLKIHSGNKRFFSLLQNLAAWREREAQQYNLPRGRILRDDSLLDLASSAPTSEKQLMKIRGIGDGATKDKRSEKILATIRFVLDLPESKLSTPPKNMPTRKNGGALAELLRVLLKAKSRTHQVAQKLIASAEDLDRIACGQYTGLPCLKDWRFEVFGRDALALCSGSLALAVQENQITLIPIDHKNRKISEPENSTVNNDKQ